MFEDIKDNHPNHITAIKTAYSNTIELGLSAKPLKYRKLSGNDFKKLFQVVDMLQEKLNYDHEPGSCVIVHPALKQLFSRHGYLSELVFGDVLINGEPHMNCNIDTLKEQINIGTSHEYQRVHCWLLLENGQFFDATLIRDLSDGKHAGEIYNFGHTESEGNNFNYKPILVGSEFIEKTNPQRKVYM